MMGGRVVNLFVLVAIGVIIADLVQNYKGTATLFSGMANLWATSVNGMLGKSPAQSGTNQATLA